MTSSFGDPGYNTPSGDQDVTRTATVNLRADTANYAAQMASAGTQTSLLASAVSGLTAKLDGLGKRAGHKLELFGAGTGAAMGGFVADAAALDKQMGTLHATTAVAGGSFNALKDQVTAAFTKFPVARGDTVALSTAISNMSVTGARDIGALTQTFIKLGASTGESTTGLASGLIQLSRLMGTTGSTQIGNYANALLTVSKKAGVSASSVVEFSQAIAPMARQAGIGEAAVLGISTAFSKAGADGYLAANTFNSVINDITSMVKTGSPQIAKYASFIGVTAEQFKKMPGQQQISSIFNAINAGGPKAVNFVNELGIGTRGLSAIQAVASAGGMDKAIATAQSASGDQTNLNKGASAAFDNLGDTLAKIRNQFTQLGDILGGPLLTPLNWLAKGFETMASLVNTWVKNMHGFATVLGVAVSALAAIAGLGMAHLAGMSTLAAARVMLRPNSSPRLALAQGREAGAAVRGGADEAAARGASPAGRMVLGGTALRRVRGPYEYGYQQGLAQPGAPGGFFATVRASARTAMHGEPEAAAAPAAETAPATGRHAAVVGGRHRPGNVPAPPAAPPVAPIAAPVAAGPIGAAPAAAPMGRWQRARLAVFGGAKIATGTVTGLAEGQTRAFSDVGRQKEGFNSSGFTNTMRTPRVAIAEGRAEIAQREAAGRALVGLTGDVVGAGKAVIAMDVAAVKATGALAVMAAGAVVQGATGRVPGVGPMLVRGEQKLASGIGKVAGGLASGIGKVAGAAFSLPGMLALMVGLPAVTGIIHSISGKQKASSEQAVIADLNPMKKYNDALGIATTNLATFASGLSKANPKAGVASTETTVAGARQVTGTEMTTYGGKKSSDDNITDLGRRGGKNKVAATQQLLASYQTSDPRVLDMFKQNLIAAGYSKSEVEAVMTSYQPGAKVDNQAVATVMNASQGHGGGSNPSATSVHLGAAMLTAIGASETEDLRTHSAGYAGTRKLQSEVGLISAQAAGAKGTAGALSLANTIAVATGSTQGAVAKLMAPTTGVGKTTYTQGRFDPKAYDKLDAKGKAAFVNAQTGLLSGSGAYTGKGMFDQDKFDALSDAGKAAYMGKAPVSTPHAGNLTGAGKDAFDADTFTKLSETDKGKYIIRVMGDTKEGAAQLKTLTSKTVGGVTDPAAMNAYLNKSFGISSDAQIKAAKQSGALGTFATADKSVLDATGELSGDSVARQAATEKLAAAALKTDGNSSAAAASLNKLGDTLGGTSGAFMTATAAYLRMKQSFELPYKPRAEQTAVLGANMAADVAAAVVPGASDATVAQGEQSKKDFATNIQAQTDYEKSILVQTRAFGVQRLREDHDNKVQLDIQARDYYNSQRDALYDHNLSVLRTNADFGTQLQRQAQSSAESIYDPFNRVQAKYTTDAGTTAANLADQNARIAAQSADLKKLKKMGLSQSSIDTLQLTDPNNAQQVSNLVEGYGADPKLIAQTNAAVKTRLKATKALTDQSESHRNTMADHRRDTGRTEADWIESQRRVKLAHQNGLNDMATAYKQMVARSVEDLTTAMTEINGTFADNLPKTIDSIATNINKVSPKLGTALKGVVLDIANAIAAAPPGVVPGGSGLWAYSNPHPATSTPPGHAAAPAPAQHTGGARYNAVGGIATTQHFIGEAGAEALIPLTGAGGQQFMAGMYQAVARQVVQQMHTSAHPTAPRGPSISTVSYDHSTTVSGNTFELSGVSATDVIKQLKATDRLHKLTSPARR